MNIFRQCKLISDNIITTSWIPEKFAILNKLIKLKDDDRNWIVKNIYGKLEESHLIDSHIAIKNHRKNTGDSMPKR